MPNDDLIARARQVRIGGLTIAERETLIWDLADRVEEQAELLRMFEWEDRQCQVCCGFDWIGHFPGCRLAAALGKAEP